MAERLIESDADYDACNMRCRYNTILKCQNTLYFAQYRLVFAAMAEHLIESDAPAQLHAHFTTLFLPKARYTSYFILQKIHFFWFLYI